MKAPDILDKAASHMRDRAATYDSPDGERSMGKAVAMFNACHGLQLTETQGWHLMELVKHVRFFTAPNFHADSVEDGAAYAALRGEAAARDANSKVRFEFDFSPQSAAQPKASSVLRYDMESVAHWLAAQGLTAVSAADAARLKETVSAQTKIQWQDLDRAPEKDDGWIEWNGGECPEVGLDTVVECKMRNGELEQDKTGKFIWQHDNDEADIIAYRIAK